MARDLGGHARLAKGQLEDNVPLAVGGDVAADAPRQPLPLGLGLLHEVIDPEDGRAAVAGVQRPGVEENPAAGSGGLGHFGLLGDHEVSIGCFLDKVKGLSQATTRYGVVGSQISLPSMK